MVEYKFEHSLSLLPNPYRYMCVVGLGIRLKPFLIPYEHEAIIDTGCANMLVHLDYARWHGKRINHTQTVIIGGSKYEATLYTIRYFHVGDFCIRNLPVLAAEYTGSWARNILIGASILKNWNFGLKADSHELYFSETSDKYNYFFDEFGNYQEVLSEDFDEDEE